MRGWLLMCLGVVALAVPAQAQVIIPEVPSGGSRTFQLDRYAVRITGLKVDRDMTIINNDVGEKFEVIICNKSAENDAIYSIGEREVGIAPNKCNMFFAVKVLNLRGEKPWTADIYIRPIN